MPGEVLRIAGWGPKRIPEDDVIRQIDGPLRHKALFGSDYPLLKRTRIVAGLDQIPFKDGVKQALMSDNPRRLLGL